MIKLSNLSEDNYFLPEDGDAAKQAFLDLLREPGEAYVHAFGFNMPEAFDILAAQEASGHAQNLLLDYTQSRGRSAVGLVTAYAAKIKTGSLTLTTAGVGSKKTSQIWHSKAITKIPADGSEPLNWEGSVNMSGSGWFQGNTARIFRSKEWSDTMIAQYTQHRAWAREHMAHKQVSALSVEDGIRAYFDEIDQGVLAEFAMQCVGLMDPRWYALVSPAEDDAPQLELSFHNDMLNWTDPQQRERLSRAAFEGAMEEWKTILGEKS